MIDVAKPLADWAAALDWSDVPSDVQQMVQMRILDTLGVMLAATTTQIGRDMARYAAISGGDAAHVIGHGRRTGGPPAVLANGTLAAALDYDDTHIQTIVHVTGPVLASALAEAEICGATGTALLAAVAAGSEATSRIAMVAPGLFGRRGFHPTGVLSGFGAAIAAARVVGVGPGMIRHALGIAATRSAGLMQSFENGANLRLVHTGLAAETGFTASLLARSGVMAPPAALEGEAGFFAAHLQSDAADADYSKMTGGFGTHWEMCRIALKPYPCAHVLHAFVDAALALKRSYGFTADQIADVECRVADYMVPLVCEPAEAKMAPKLASAARISLNFTLALALSRGQLHGASYAIDDLDDPHVLDLASRVRFTIDETAPGRERFKGWVIVRLRDGRVLERVEDHNRGSMERPLSRSDVIDKFMANAAPVRGDAIARSIVTLVDELAEGAPIGAVIAACCDPGSA